jgi:seryl-tRNA synthetase
MLQVNMIRQETEKVKEKLLQRNFSAIDIVDTVIALDDERKKVPNSAFDTTQAKINAASKEIGKLMAQGNREEAEHN